jgi:hypothetical protein
MKLFARFFAGTALAGLLTPALLTPGMLGAPALAQTSTLPLAAPPVASNAAASSIFDAMLAISRATQTNPAAAQAASFPYAAAIQRYNAGDLLTARMQALNAISAAATTAPAPPSTGAVLPAGSALAAAPALAPVPFALPLNPAQADAEAFLAVSRRALATCAVTAAAPRAQLQRQYETAVQANVAQRYNDVRADSQAIINACATPQKP